MVISIEQKRVIYAVSTIAGTTIGAGIFGLPYVINMVGYTAGLVYFLVIALVMVFLNLFYGEIVLRTAEPHGLGGYAGKYLGRQVGWLARISQIIGYNGALLAFLVIGGEFLTFALGPIFGGGEKLYTLIFFVIVAFLVLLGVILVREAELIMNIFLFLAFILILIFSFSFFKFSNFTSAPFAWKNFLLPYGVLLFALESMSSIPHTMELATRERAKGAVAWGTIIPAIFSLLFTFLVIGAIGGGVPRTAIGGFADILSPKIFALGIYLGLLAVVTSFFVTAVILKKIYYHKFGVGKFGGFALATFLPLALYFLGLNDFIKILFVTGAVFFSIDGIILCLTYLQAKKFGDRQPEYNLKSNLSAYLIIIFLALGLISSLAYLLIK